MVHISHKQTVTRETQKVDVIYVGLDKDPEPIFVTTDGEGRYWYDSIDEAREQHGDDLPVCYLEETPED